MCAKSIYYDAKQPFPQTSEDGAAPAPWDKTNIVGGRVPRVDGYDRVSGAAVYPSDVVLPGMLYAAAIVSPHPNAVLKRLDVDAALQMPGVKAVLAPDSPEANLPWSYEEMEVKLLDRNCRYEGQVVGAVAAETPYQAADAVRALQARWEPLPYVVEPMRALERGAPKVHPDGNVVEESEYARGDAEQGFKDADVVVEREYLTRVQLHTPLELHGCVARWDGPQLTVWESTQGVYAVQERVAKTLGLPHTRVRVVGHYVGGGFGSKLRASKYSILAAVLAKKTNRPVKFFHTREETMLAMGNRPSAHMRLKAGVKQDGSLTAIRFEGVGPSGGYPAGGTSLLEWQAKDLYRCPNVATKTTDVYINAGPARPFRAPGYPQGNWAMEQMMDELAEALEMDPVRLRLANIPETSQGRDGQPPYTTNGLAECLRRGAERFGWEAARKAVREQPEDAVLRRGVGMAACNWFVGGGWPPSTVVVKMNADGSVNLNMGCSDIGTGAKTAMAVIVAEELGVTPDSVLIENADTGATQYSPPSGGSKTLPSDGPAVRLACVNLKEQLMEMAAEDLETDAADLVFAGERIHHKDDADKGKAVRELSRLQQQKTAMGVGHKKPNPKDKQVTPFGAQFCEVEVNTRTGEIALLRFVAAHESGRVIDRLAFDSQVIGGVAMGVGLGMTEMRVLDVNTTGKLCNKNWHDYKLPTALDVAPDMVSEAVELPDDEANAIGAKGLGEPVTVPTASAIANAVYNAVGVRCFESPINPVTLVAKLADRTVKYA